MTQFILSAFADEISPWLEQQMDVLDTFSIQHIEMRGVNNRPLVEHSLEEVRQIKQRLDERGFRISSVGSPIGKIFITDDFAPHLALFKHTLEIAKILQAPFIRMFSFFIAEGDNADNYHEDVVHRWQQFITAAEPYDVVLLHENEKDIYGDTAERCLRLFNALNSPKVKAVFDPANFIQCGVKPFPQAFDLLRQHIVYIHIKDALSANQQVVPAGEGKGEIAAMLQRLDAENYQGFLSLEPHLADFSGFSALEKSTSGSSTQAEGEAAFVCAAQALLGLLKAQGH